MKGEGTKEVIIKHEVSNQERGKPLPTLNNACSPFSAACSSSRRRSSSVRFPAFSAAWIWSKTDLSSMAERTVDMLGGWGLVGGVNGVCVVREVGGRRRGE